MVEIIRNVFARGRLRRNLTFKLVSDVAARALQFGFIIVAARRLGASEFGAYSYAIALGLVLAQACDLGLQLFVTREVARTPTNGSRILGTALVAKLFLFAVCITILGVLVYTQPGAGDQVTLLVLAMGALLTSFVEFFNYSFRGYQRLEFEAGLNVTNRLLGPGLGALALALGAPLQWVAWLLLLANALAVALGYHWLRSRFVRPDFRLQRELLGYAVRQVLPLGLGILFSGLYVRAGVLWLQQLQSLSAVGWFNAAQRLTDPMQMLPAIGLAVVFPALSAERDFGMRRKLAGRTLGLLLVLGAGLAAVGWFSAGQVIGLLYGSAFLPSALVLRWLALALAPMFLNYALTHFLIALGRQWWNALFSLLMLLTNTGLNLMLIPRLGAEGAAIAVLLAELLLFALCAATLLATPAWHASPAPRLANEPAA